MEQNNQEQNNQEQNIQAQKKQTGLTLRACKNTLGRLKVQILLRLAFVMLGLLPLSVGFGAWRMWLVLLGLVFWTLPEALLCFYGDFAQGVFNTDRAYEIIGYDGFFPKRKLDLLLENPRADKKKLALSIVLLVFLGFALNIRSIVRLCASFVHINCSLPHAKGSFAAVKQRFMQGLGLVLVVCIIFFVLISLLANPLIDVAGRSHHDPYRIRMAVSQEDELQVLQNISTSLRDENYFYFVDIPFNENGFDTDASGKQSASYLAEISHANGTHEMWEIVLTLSEERSSGWNDVQSVVHPIHFDMETQQEIVYVSGATEKTLHYRDDSGTYVQVAVQDAPAPYQTLARYILLDEVTIAQMQKDPEHLAADAAEELIHMVYETESERITIGIRDGAYPFEVSFRDETLQYSTRAIRFDATHTFNLP